MKNFKLADIDRNALYTVSIIDSWIDDAKQQLMTGADLETLPYTYLLKLERVPHWKGHIEYVITLTKTLSDGTKTQDLREVFPGKDRRAAFARAAELRHQRPGIPYEEDITRRPWE